jgi:hypothetical protein
VARPSLFHTAIYLTQLERLRAKRRRRGPRSASNEDVALLRLLGRDSELCRRVASEVERGTYQFSPLARVNVWHEGKRRTIHRIGFLDALVLGAMAQRVTAMLETKLDDCVHAYRPGRGSQRTIAAVRDHLNEHRGLRPDARTRGVFVLQRDLAAYGESIPTAAESQLWPLLRKLLDDAADQREARVLYALLERACRPEVRLTTGEVVVMQHGLPTGSPIQQPLANLYLMPLDHALRAVNPEFYARFGDDVLVLDSDVERATRAAATMDDITRNLGLTWSASKLHNWYFTLPGRPYLAPSTLVFKPTSHVEYLGVRMTFDGRLGLKRSRLRQLLQRTRWRIETTLGVVPDIHAVEAVAKALERAIHHKHTTGDPSVEALRTWVDDRHQLRQLDRHITALCAEGISGIRGVRAFRRVTAQTLRDAGLPSLLQLRRRDEGDA